MPKFRILISRRVIEKAWVEVEAESRPEAVDKALQADIPDWNYKPGERHIDEIEGPMHE